jgi:hypothetical protein
LEVSTIKEYVKSFVSEGVSLKQAYKMTYATPDQIKEIEKDKTFIAEIESCLLQLSLDRIRTYNERVDSDGKPSDDLKRLSTIMEVIEKDKEDTPRDIQVTIVKQRGADAS